MQETGLPVVVRSVTDVVSSATSFEARTSQNPSALLPGGFSLLSTFRLLSELMLLATHGFHWFSAVFVF